MRLRVFGRTSDEKGSQLEELTRRLLARLGYTNLSLNVVGAGGGEVDVQGELRIPGLAGDTSLRVVGECKAYESPVGMSDWLKFLGKVYSEQARNPNPVRGTLVALSGANGNVRGAAEQLRMSRTDVELVDGEALISLVQVVCEVSPLASVAARARQMTNATVAEFSLGYYCGRAFWVLHFADGAFALMLGVRLDERPEPDLVELVEAQLQGAQYRDLLEEEEHRQHLVTARKLILSRLVAARATVSREALSRAQGDVKPTEAAFAAAFDALAKEQLITELVEGVELANIDDDDSSLLRVLREITDTTAFALVFFSSGWLSLVNERLVHAIARLQGELPLPPDVVQESVSLLRWSPTAIAWGVRPDQMLIGHRRTPEERASAGANDVRYFRLQLLRHAVDDFVNGSYAESHFELLDLREVEFIRRAKFKSKSRVELEVEVAERVAVARGAPEFGGGIVKIWVHENAPEPWAWPGAVTSSGSDEGRET